MNQERPILFGEPKLTLVNLVDVLSIDNLHRCNPLITSRTMDVGAFIGEVIDEYASKVFCDTVTMNFQQSSPRPLFIFQQLLATPAINGKDLIFGQFLHIRPVLLFGLVHLKKILFTSFSTMRATVTLQSVRAHLA